MIGKISRRDDGLHARQRERAGGVDLHDPGMGMRAAHHGGVQHAGQLVLGEAVHLLGLKHVRELVLVLGVAAVEVAALGVLPRRVERAGELVHGGELEDHARGQPEAGVAGAGGESSFSPILESSAGTSCFEAALAACLPPCPSNTPKTWSVA